MDDQQPLSERSRWPRFSLPTAFLLMTIVCLATVMVLLWREVGPLRAEVRRLRDEVGALSVDDPTKPCAIRVRTKDEYTWKWRVWIPEGREYRLKYSGEQIPKNGIPQSHGSITLSDPGEIWIEYRISPNPQSEQWSDKLYTPNAAVGSAMQKWVKWTRRTTTNEGISYTTQVTEPGKIIVLNRERVSQTAADSSRIEDPSAGFMIWLEPLK
jgi:hypothetical protein